MVVQTPCTPWSILQQTNQRTPAQVRNLKHKKEEARSYIGWVGEKLNWQRERGRCVLHENPNKSSLWKEAPIEAAFSTPDSGVGKVDLCMYDKRRPDTDELVKKSMTFKGTPEVCEGIERICNKTHNHSQIGGSIAANPEVGRPSMSMSEWSGGYTRPLAEAIVSSSEACLEKRLGAKKEEQCFPTARPNQTAAVREMCDAAARVAEESFTCPGEEVHDGNWSSCEIPAKVREKILRDTPKEVRQQVRKSHAGLGHPTRETFLRMLRLGGASQAVIEYAKHWRCPVCQESAPPSSTKEVSAKTRPYAFGKVVCMDLKYLKDAEENHHVAMSAVDAGTSWHGGCLLKNRTPEHVVRRFLEVWIAHYGVPELIICDQGGEFYAAFVEMCEEFGIDTKVVGSHAAWQHGFAERHGGILGEMFAKVVHQHGIVGREKCKIAYAVCLQAKNGTMTRNGMTAEQAVFGRCLKWFPSDNQDDDQVMLAALGSDGEAWLQAQMRATARIALISKDASDKARQAMMRKAPAVVGDIPPGSRVYFWHPHPLKKGRDRRDPTRWRGPATVIAKESQSRVYIGWRARTLLVAKEDLRHATLEECAAADTIAKDATLTGEQKHYEDTTVSRTGNKSDAAGSQDGGPTIPRETPEGDECVYERMDRDAKNFVLSRVGGPVNDTIMRREIFDLRTGKRLETYRCSVGDITGERIAELTGPVPKGVRDIFTRLYYRVPRVPEGVLRLNQENQEDQQPLMAVEDALADFDDTPNEPMAIEDAAERCAQEQVEQEQERQAEMPIVAMEAAERKRVALDDVPLSVKKPRF